MTADPLAVVTDIAQRLMRDVPLVVLGSGASCAYGLPSMGQLAAALIDRVRAEGAAEEEAWARLRARLAAGVDLESALAEAPLPPTLLDRVVRVTWEVVSASDLAVHDLVVRGRLRLPLERLVRRHLDPHDARPFIVTTNYDRLAEYAVDCAGGAAVTGIGGGWIQRETGWRPLRRGQVGVVKVHGSLDWFADGVRNVGVPLARAIPADLQPLIVTPGVFKYRQTHLEPYRSTMQVADEAVRGTRALLCIGYGFNDEHVQQSLLRRIRDGAPVIVLNRTLSGVARDLLLAQRPARYLFLERSGTSGIRAWHHQAPGPVELGDGELWSLDGFLGLIEPREAN